MQKHRANTINVTFDILLNFIYFIYLIVKVHMKHHSGDNYYKCRQCDFVFSSESSLKFHWKLHSGEKWFTCGQCDYGFIQAGLCEDTFENSY